MDSDDMDSAHHVPKNCVAVKLKVFRRTESKELWKLAIAPVPSGNVQNGFAGWLFD